MNPATLSVAPSSFDGHLIDFYLGDDEIWGIDDLNDVQRIDFQGESRAVGAVPRDCDGRSGAVFRESLWLLCGRRLTFYSATASGIRETFRAPPKRVFVAAENLWVVVDDKLMSIAGNDRGRIIDLPSRASALWQGVGDEAWGMSFGEGIYLMRVNLAQGSVQRLALPDSRFVGEFAIVDSEVWVSYLDEPKIFVYAQESLANVESVIDLGAFVEGGELGFTPTPGSRVIWVRNQFGTESRVLRATRLEAK